MAPARFHSGAQGRARTIAGPVRRKTVRQVRFHCESQSQSPVPFTYCYCSICRKTAGGSGSAINLGADATTLQTRGEQHLGVYRARIEDGDECRVSSAQRTFCTGCGSALWLFDPDWPELIHPHASAIDTPLPRAPQRRHMMLGSKANWVQVPQDERDEHFQEFPQESPEEWHRRHGQQQLADRSGAADSGE